MSYNFVARKMPARRAPTPKHGLNAYTCEFNKLPDMPPEFIDSLER